MDGMIGFPGLSSIALTRSVGFLLAGSLACTSTPATANTTPTPPGPPETWDLVWSDEFSGPAGASFDTTKWRPDTADGCSSGNCGWGNQEKEYYTTSPENIALDGS